MVDIIDRGAAREAGLTHYFTGVACRHGHLEPRYVNSTCCVKCAALRDKPRTAEEKARRKIAEGSPEYLAKRRVTQKKWATVNQEWILQTQRARRHTLIGRARSMAQNAQVRAKARQEFCDVTTEYLTPLLREALEVGVVTCDSERPDTASLDRIDSSKGYIQGNVQVVPWWYNAAKHDFKAEDLHVAMLNWRLVYG